MNRARSAVLSGVLALVAASAHAGAGVAQATMKPVSTRVTYSADAVGKAPQLDTYIGYQLLLTNAGTNTLNAVQFTVTISATDGAERVNLFLPETLPAGCTPEQTTPPVQPSTFTCVVGQMKAGATFPASGSVFVYYKAPVKVVNNVADADDTDVVNANVHVVYAEGLNGPNSQPQNSIVDWPAGPVTLGTFNPTDVKTVVPPPGNSLFTGLGGVPTSANQLTEVVAVPSFGSGRSDTAAIHIDSVASTNDVQCGNLGHFVVCPTYTTTVVRNVLDQAVEAQFLAPWLVTTYRIDASNLKLPPSKILSSTELRYTGGTFTNALVGACTNNAPDGTGLPCILQAQCYKRSTPGWTPDLDGDCEWTLINTRNGSVKIQ